jgi:hypothetical protein
MFYNLLMFRTSSDESSIELTSATKRTNTLASVKEHGATTQAKVGVSDLLRGNTSDLLTPRRYFVHRCRALRQNYHCRGGAVRG